MKEKFKNNKWALVLFIATICIIVSTIVGIIIMYVMLPQVLDEAKIAFEGQGYSKELIDAAIEGAKGILLASVIILIIITIFVSLCGFKCSLKSEWRKGAIVFGAIFVFFDFITILKNTDQIATVLSNLLSIALSTLYLIGAIKCDDANDFSSKNIL